MPKLDGTGPRGQGALSGRGQGPCGQGGFYGRGRGCGFQGNGMGSGCGYRSRLTQAEELELLKQDQTDLQAELKAIAERLKELQK